MAVFHDRRGVVREVSGGGGGDHLQSPAHGPDVAAAGILHISGTDAEQASNSDCLAVRAGGERAWIPGAGYEAADTQSDRVGDGDGIQPAARDVKRTSIGRLGEGGG